MYRLLLATLALHAEIKCDLSAYKPQEGIAAQMRLGTLELSWQGEKNERLRARFDIRNGVPVIQQLAVGATVLGRDLEPEYQLTTALRRMTTQQVQPLQGLGVALTPDVINREKWNAFWDAPLMVPGRLNTNLDLPRKPEEIQVSAAKFKTTSCVVRTAGARVEVEFNGFEAGSFAGSLRFTAYKGSNLMRQEAIAKTGQPSVAYKYNGGLRGFAIGENTRMVWRDTARGWQHYAFGGSVNDDSVALRARNRLAILETHGGSIAVFPPSHKFFWSREIETNLGYVYYRKESDTKAAIGVRQNDREVGAKPWGVSDAVWNRRVSQTRSHTHNFALYNAPAGTMQRMPVYYYLSNTDGSATQQAVMALTNDDVYKPLPGYKVLVSHFHFHYNEQLTDLGTLDFEPTWLPVFRDLGVNIAILADFHSDSHATDTGKVRLDEQKVYFQGCERFSGKDLLLIPGEEPDARFGGHYLFLFPRPIYYTHGKPKEKQPFVEDIAGYGKVYHTDSAADELEFLKRENGLVWQTHPRTKGSTGYPDAVRDRDFFKSDRFLGGSFQSLPVDLSEQRICEKRCFELLDDMNNWGAPKYMLAEGDTYMKYPDDETYPQLMVNYVKLDRVPKFKDGWTPVVKALRAGDFFVTTGEVLLRNWALNAGTFTAEAEWRFPPEFAELVWSDGAKVDRQIIDLRDKPPASSHKFSIPFNTAGKKWVRFAVWDSAGNGAFTQPVHLR